MFVSSATEKPSNQGGQPQKNQPKTRNIARSLFGKSPKHRGLVDKKSPSDVEILTPYKQSNTAVGEESPSARIIASLESEIDTFQGHYSPIGKLPTAQDEDNLDELAEVLYPKRQPKHANGSLQGLFDQYVQPEQNAPEDLEPVTPPQRAKIRADKELPNTHDLSHLLKDLGIEESKSEQLDRLLDT